MWRQNIKRFISTEGEGLSSAVDWKQSVSVTFPPNFFPRKSSFQITMIRHVTLCLWILDLMCGVLSGTCDLQNFQRLVFVLSDFTTQQQYWAVRLLISQMETIKDTVVISQGTSVLLFPLSTSTFMLHNCCNCCKTTNNDYSRVSRLSRLFLQHLPQNRSY